MKALEVDLDDGASRFCHKVELYELNAVDPKLESARFLQPLKL
jgi:hypothetical protein